MAVSRVIKAQIHGKRKRGFEKLMKERETSMAHLLRDITDAYLNNPELSPELHQGDITKPSKV